MVAALKNLRSAGLMAESALALNPQASVTDEAGNAYLAKDLAQERQLTAASNGVWSAAENGGIYL